MLKLIENFRQINVNAFRKKQGFTRQLIDNDNLQLHK